MVDRMQHLDQCGGAVGGPAGERDLPLEQYVQAFRHRALMR